MTKKNTAKTAAAQLNVKVGDRVRSFDFDSRDADGQHANYMEGIVQAIGKPVAEATCDCYTILIDRVVWRGDDQANEFVGRLVHPPVNGTPTSLGRTTHGVHVLKTAAELEDERTAKREACKAERIAGVCAVHPNGCAAVENDLRETVERLRGKLTASRELLATEAKKARAAQAATQAALLDLVVQVGLLNLNAIADPQDAADMHRAYTAALAVVEDQGEAARRNGELVVARALRDTPRKGSEVAS
jgi:hypothetical protein